MAIDVFEAQDSQRVKVTATSGGDSLGLRVFITGTDDREAALTALLGEISNVLPIGTRSVLADQVDLQPYGHKSWVADVAYTSPELSNTARQPKAIGECTFEFDGMGGTTKLDAAFAMARFPGTCPDLGLGIGLTPEGRPQGVDIVVPKLSFTVTQRFAGETITLEWLRNLVLMTGTMNSDTFLGFEPGEVLFLGPAGSQPLAFMDDGSVVKGERDVAFRFAVSPNLANVTIAGVTGVTKRGHDYLWVNCIEELDSNKKFLSSSVSGVYVYEVYRSVAFASIGVADPSTDFPVVG